MDKQNGLGRILILAIVSRILILATAYFLGGFFDNHTPLIEFIETFTRRWDGNSFSFIAENGYVSQGEERVFIVFPPLYPILIGLANVFVRNIEISGFIISNVFFFVSVCLFYKLLKVDYSEKFSTSTVALFIVFPTSYFFSVSYAESVFTAFLFGTFYLARLGRLCQASLLAIALTLTKPFGALIWPCLLIESLVSKKRNLLLAVSIVTFAAFAVGIYLAINYSVFKDPFAFQKFLNQNWFKNPQLPTTGIINAWKRGLSGPWNHYRLLVGLAEAVTGTAAYLLLALGFLKKFRLRTSYYTYSLLGVLFFTSTGFVLSSPRYLLSVPFLFIFLNHLLINKALMAIWIFLSLAALTYLTATFALGRWAF
ncbi:hypothetical protein HYT59_02690 [Candidatus Woesebacteria bacterium]|nr:hypothetical protein [Candidatus Woesebacteria bacterium]